MTGEEFIKELDKKGYSYEIEGDKIVVTYEMGVDLRSLTSLPPGVEFNNGGSIDLYYLTSLPPGVAFRNGGSVNLNSLTSLPPGVEFNSEGYVDLGALTSLPPGVVFKNRGRVYLRSLTGRWFDEWEGNIEGIEPKRLLNKMISLGIFER